MLKQRDIESAEMIKGASTTTGADGLIDKYGKYLFCFFGLQISYVLWGVTQENLMTTEYKLGKFKSSSFCVFANRLLALVISFLIVVSRKYFSNQNQAHEKNKVIKEVPFYYYAPSSLSNTMSSWAQYEALKYVSFPIQVLSKSCKIIPVMLVRNFKSHINFDIYFCLGWYFDQ